MKIGIIGCGEIAQEHIRAAKGYRTALIVGLVDSDAKALAATAKRFHIKHTFSNPREMIDRHEPDLIHIVTPPQSHFELTQMALESGCHVMLEKPMCMNASEARDLVKLAKDRNRTLCIDHNHLFDPVITRARRLVQEGAVGTLCGVESYYGFDLGSNPQSRYFSHAYDHWAYHLPGGLFQNLLDHPLYLLLEFIPNPVQIASMAREVGILPTGVPDELRMLIGDGKVMGQVVVSMAATPRFHYLTLLGTRGSVHVDLLNKRLVHYRQRNVPKPISRALMNLEEGWTIIRTTLSNTLKVVRHRFTPYDGTRVLIHKLYESIERGTPPPVSAERGLQVMEIMDSLWKGIGYPSLSGSGAHSRSSASDSPQPSDLNALVHTHERGAR